MKEPRIGVWICDCAGMISDHLDTKRIEESARGLPHVSIVKRTDKLCGREDLERLEREIKANGVDRLLFAGCSPRSSLKFPEEQLTSLMRRAGMDKAFFEVANLREQCAWLHDDVDAATRKGIDLVRMAHARLRSVEPAPAPARIVPRALVIGGGAAGLQAAKSLAAAGQKVVLLERGTYLGGRLCQIGFLFQCESWPAYCRSECVGPVQAMDAVLNPNIEVLMQSDVLGIEKINGNFQVRIKRGAAFVDPEKCISCKACAEACPEGVTSDYEMGLAVRKAIDKDFERALPDTYTIIDEACTRCGKCLPACPTAAINLEAKPHITEDTFGALFLATGFEQYDLGQNRELGSAEINVLTGLEFERVMDRGMLKPSDGETPARVVFVLCAGSRATLERAGQGVPYCSKTCCAATVKQAERVLARNPETEVIVVYHHDIRTYERAFESFYTHLKVLGVEFVNGDVKGVDATEGGGLKVRIALRQPEPPMLDNCDVDDQGIALNTDLLVLAAAQTPRKTTSPLLQQLGVQVDRHGFPIESQVRLFRPTESMVDRVFAIGAAVGPKIVQQSVEQGSAAAMKALPVLMSGSKETGKFASVISDRMCTRCRTCMTVCPHGAIRMTDQGAVSDPAFCQACGFCAAACPTHAAQLVNFTDRQILDQAAVAFDHLPPADPKILALLCYWCSYSGGDLAGVKGMKAPPNFRSIRIRCSSSVNSGLVMEMFRMGIDGVLIAGCPEKNCHHAWGNYLSERRIALMRNLFSELGLSPKRLRFEYIGVPQSQKFVSTIIQMDKDLRALGPNPVPAAGRS